MTGSFWAPTSSFFMSGLDMPVPSPGWASASSPSLAPAFSRPPFALSDTLRVPDDRQRLRAISGLCHRDGVAAS